MAFWKNKKQGWFFCGLFNWKTSPVTYKQIISLAIAIMDLEYNLLNILVLFGAIQGFLLCFLLYKKRRVNKLSAYFFILFLFSLSFYNLMYSFLSMDLFKYYRPLHVFPYPFKWLIGVGFYFFVKYQFKSSSLKLHHQKEWYLFLPAIIYLLLRTYWFTISSMENSYRIIKIVVDSNFFRIQEFLILIFNSILFIRLLSILNKHNIKGLKNEKTIKWLHTFVWVYLGLTLINLITYSIDILIHNGQESFAFIYPTLILNVLFIYWIGFMGFTKSNRFFKNISIENNFSEALQNNIANKLQTAIINQKLYKQPNLTINQLSSDLDISPKELSKFINERHKMNFSEYINYHRIEDIKELLRSPEAQKFTLVSLAELAGFNSKSSFNAIFKKMTGTTPSEYKRAHNSE